MPSPGLFRCFMLACLVSALLPAWASGDTPDATAWFSEGDVACGRVALIFNIGDAAGPGGNPSETIRQTLEEQDVPATMFPTGEFATAHPDYLRRLDEAGFEIGVHRESAPGTVPASDDAMLADMRASIAAIEGAIGRRIDPYYTSYGANPDDHVVAPVFSGGLLPVGWKVSAPDWTPNATEDAVYRAVVDNVYPGAIVSLHLDGAATEVSTALALPRIVDELRGRGYDFVTIGEMLQPCLGTPVPFPATVTLTGLDVHGLHCKAAPSRGATMIRILLDGETVTVRGPVFDGWLPVVCAGQAGWIRADAIGADRGLFGTWGAFRTAAGQANASGFSADGFGNVFIAEYEADAIQKYSADARYLLRFGTPGTGQGQFDGPSAPSFDGEGNMYIADEQNSRVQVWDPEGNFLAEWGGHW